MPEGSCNDPMYLEPTFDRLIPASQVPQPTCFWKWVTFMAVGEPDYIPALVAVLDQPHEGG